MCRTLRLVISHSVNASGTCSVPRTPVSTYVRDQCAAVDAGRGRIIEGFTPDQRFFLGFAQVQGQNMMAEEARRHA